MGVKHSLYMHMTSISKNINTEKHTSWHVIRTSPNGDASATKELKQEGLEAYSPCITSYCNQKNTYKICNISAALYSKQLLMHLTGWFLAMKYLPYQTTLYL